MGQTRRQGQTGQQAQPEPTQPEAAGGGGGGGGLPTAEELAAELARLREENEQLRAQRKPRERRMTPKQRKLVEYLREHPEASIAEACEAAGATATSHGLVFRMIEDGYLRVSPAAPTDAPTDQEDSEDAPTEEQVGQDA